MDKVAIVFFRINTLYISWVVYNGSEANPVWSVQTFNKDDLTWLLLLRITYPFLSVWSY